MAKLKINRFTSIATISFILLTTVFSFSLPNPEKQVVGSGESGNGVRLIIAASKDENGADGHATFVDTYENARIKMDIIDISIVSTDRIAELVGVVTSTSGDTFSNFPIGQKVTFYVEDNGEGPDSISDGFSLPNEKPGKKRFDGGVYPEVIRGNFRVTGIGADTPPGEETPPKG